MSLEQESAKSSVVLIIRTLCMLIGGVFLTRILGAEGRGILQKIEVGVGLLIRTITLKADLGITYFLAKTSIKKKQIIGFSLVVIIVSLALSVFFIFFIREIKFDGLFLSDEYSGITYYKFLILILIVTLLSLFLSSILRGLGKFNEIYGHYILGSIVRLLVIVVAYFFFGIRNDHIYGLKIHLFTLGFSASILLFYFFRDVASKVSLKFTWKEEVKPIMKYSSKSYLAVNLNFLSRSIDIWIVDYFLGISQLGIYSVAYNLSAFLLLFSTSLGEVLIPKIASLNKSESIHQFRFISRAHTMGILLITALLIFSSDFLIPTLYGKEFTSSVIPFKLLCIAMSLNAIGIVFSIYNYGVGNVRINIITSGLGFLLSIPSYSILIPKYGLVGAGISAIIVQLVTMIVSYILFMKTNHHSYRNFFILSRNDVNKLLNFLKKLLNDISRKPKI